MSGGVSLRPTEIEPGGDTELHLSRASSSNSQQQEFPAAGIPSSRNSQQQELPAAGTPLLLGSARDGVFHPGGGRFMPSCCQG